MEQQQRFVCRKQPQHQNNNLNSSCCFHRMQNCIHCPLEWFNPKHHWKSSTLFFMRIGYVLLCTLCMRWFGVCVCVFFCCYSLPVHLPLIQRNSIGWNKICMQIHQLSMQLDQWTSENVNFSPQNPNKWRCIFVMGENLWHNQANLNRCGILLQLYIYWIRSDIFTWCEFFFVIGYIQLLVLLSLFFSCICLCVISNEPMYSSA